jgi:hypothetical protein
MSLEYDLLCAFEGHESEEIRKVMRAGISPVDPINGKRPIDILIEMYFRSPRFADCLRVMLAAGATIDDPLVRAVLLDDAAAVRTLARDRQNLERKITLLCAYTSCKGVTALHICAEYNCVESAKALLEAGANVNSRADIDADGLGGQTPIFHAVNNNHGHWNRNYCRPVMELLADAGADLEVRVKGLVWGDTMPWETVVFDVTPISYAQCGLYRQFHRPEADVYENLSILYRKRYGVAPPIRNVPNKYLTE